MRVCHAQVRRPRGVHRHLAPQPRWRPPWNWRPFAIALGVVVLAWAVYRPDRPRPFSILDFSEFLPLLQQGETLSDRAGALVEYYGTQGRFNVFPYMIMATKWTLLGSWSPGWQVTRAVLMLIVAGMTFLLLRRLGATAVGAMVGASVFLWAPAASEGWVHLTMGEPLATALTLGLSIRAIEFQRRERWKGEIALFALGGATLVLVKELVIPLLLLPLTLALTVRPDASIRRPEASRRNLVLIGAVAIAVLLAFVPVVWLYLHAPESAYGAQFARRTQSLVVLVAIWAATLVPFEVILYPASVLWLVAFAGFVILIAAGWRLGFQHPVEGSRARWLLAFALLLPAAGTLPYLLIYWYHRFYSLPYLIGTALFAGMAATFLELYAPRGRGWVLGSWAAASVLAVSGAATLAARTDATQRRDARIVQLVSEMEPDSVLFATSRIPSYEWLGTGATLHRYAGATGRPWPLTREAPCDAGRTAISSRRAVLVVSFLELQCNLPARATDVVSIYYRRVDWNRWRVVQDSQTAILVVPRANADVR